MIDIISPRLRISHMLIRSPLRSASSALKRLDFQSSYKPALVACHVTPDGVSLTVSSSSFDPSSCALTLLFIISPMLVMVHQWSH